MKVVLFKTCSCLYFCYISICSHIYIYGSPRSPLGVPRGQECVSDNSCDVCECPAITIRPVQLMPRCAGAPATTSARI